MINRRTDNLSFIFYIIEKCKTIFFIKTFAKKREKSSKIEEIFENMTYKLAFENVAKEWLDYNLKKTDKTMEFNYNKVDFDKNGFGNSNSGYTPMNRYLNNSYSLICEYENDRFSVLEMYGNGELSNSIGLITLDELFYTGFLKDPKNNYLYTNDLYWTMSPAYFLNGNAYNFVVNKNNITQLNVSKESGIRPVITLKGNIDVLEGNGSIDNPYVITK